MCKNDQFLKEEGCVPNWFLNVLQKALKFYCFINVAFYLNYFV